MARVPTKTQAERLCTLARPGTLLVSGITGEKRVWRSMLKHEWVKPDDPENTPENGLEITPAGLRALADALEQGVLG